MHQVVVALKESRFLFGISPTANLQQINEIITASIGEMLTDNPFVDHTKPIRTVCEEIESSGVQLNVQIFYRADQSSDQLTTIVLELVNRLLREQHALPFMSIALKDR